MSLARALVAAVALEHAAFLVLEMFLWTKPIGLRVFRNTPESARASKVLAMNQGLYNGFLAAGLIWGLTLPPETGRPVQIFFLVCAAAAGVFGAITANPRIFLIQAAPALAGLWLLR